MRKLDRLIKEARERATWREHKMGRFIRHPKGYFATSICANCGYTITVEPHPLPNSTEISGKAIARVCPVDTLTS